LWAIHDHRATLSASPNFGYEFCLRKIKDSSLEGLNLSSWRIGFNGAEAVHADTVARFTRRFAKYGFREETFLPVYGMAEASVALCFSPLGRPPRIDSVAREPFERCRKAVPASSLEPSPFHFVSCGYPVSGHEIRLVDEQGKELGERIEGNLQFKGPSVMKGYYRNEEMTQASFHDGWLDSGDLAYRVESEVFITGRKKDVINRLGRSFCPEEIEAVSGEITEIRKGCVASFGIADPQLGTERLVIVAESREKVKEVWQQLAAEVRKKVGGVIGIRPDVVLIVPPGMVPKTSSGKLRRSACKEAYLRGELTGGQTPPWVQVAKLWTEGLLVRIRRRLGIP
jgi:acyl-CoA synthetase (AMP-forming)/AMP-acid ligase II